MKWIGQHIWDFISRFRSDVYLEATETGTIASGGNLGLDSNNKIVKAAEVGSSVDLTSAEVTGVLTVDHGGTGASSLTDNAILTGTGASPITAESTLTYNSGQLMTSSSTSARPTITLVNSHADENGPSIIFQKFDTNGADDDELGYINFFGHNDNNQDYSFAKILGKISDATDGEEAGKIELQVAEYDGALTTGLLLDGDTDADGEIDVTIGAGAASVTTIAGTLTMGSTAAMTNAGLLSVANQSNITGLGTLTNLQVDDVNINAKSIEILGDTGDTFNITTGAAGATTLTTVDADVAAAHLTLDVDGSIILDSGNKQTYIAWNGTNLLNFDVNAMNFRIMALANQNDYFNINVAAEGATTLTTVDADTTVAHFEIAADGNITLDSAGQIKLEPAAGSNILLDNTLVVDGNVLTTVDTAHNTPGSSFTIQSGSTTAGTTDNIAGGYLRLDGGRGKGTGAGGDIIFRTAPPGSSGSSLNTPTTALTISDDLSTTIAGDLTTNGEDVLFTSSVSAHPVVEIRNITNDSLGPTLKLNNTHGGNDGDPGDFLGTIQFLGNDAGTPTEQVYGEIFTRIDDATSDQESGAMYLRVASHDGDTNDGLGLTGGSADGEVDVTIGSGTSSVTTIAGTLTMGSTAAMTNAGLVSVANQSNITGVGTITSGTWTGTAVASAYLDADTAHLTTDQTFTGVKEINSRKYALPSSTVGDYKGGDIYYYGSGSTVKGKIYFIDGGGWSLADADDESKTSGLLAVALGTDPDVDGMLLRGFVTLLTEIEGTEAIGSPLYLSATNAGIATITVPASGDFVRVLGYSLHATDNQVYFNPDNTWVERA